LPPVPAALTPFFFQPIPINSADCELLSTVKGIGPKLAQQIIDTRTANRPFKTASDLLTVPGVGPTRMGQFAPYFSFQTP
jgi:competence ComEA-like helix-hairpin-helix protein